MTGAPGKAEKTDGGCQSHQSPADLDQHHTSSLFLNKMRKERGRAHAVAPLSQNEGADGLLGWANQGCVFYQGFEFQEHKRFITSPEAAVRGEKSRPQFGVVVGWRSGD